LPRLNALHFCPTQMAYRTPNLTQGKLPCGGIKGWQPVAGALFLWESLVWDAAVRRASQVACLRSGVVVGAGREEIGFERGSLTVGSARQVAGYLLPESHRVPVHRVARASSSADERRTGFP